MRLDDLGLDRRLVAALVIGTLAAVGVGYLVAAGLDGGRGRTAAVAPPAPAVSPEAQDDGPLGAPPILPPVTVGTPPPTPAPPPATTAAAPVPRPPAAAPPATTAPAVTTAPPATTARLPTTTTAPTTTTTEPQPFRPRPASTPLAEFVVPPNELPPDAAKAMAGLSRAATRTRPGTPTAADIAYVTRLGARFATTAVSGRREAVSRTVRLNAWWYAHRDAPTGRVLVRDPDGLIYSYNVGHGFALNPVGTAGRWQRLNADVSAQALADTLMSVGVTSTRGGRRTLTWEYFDVPGVPDAIRPGVSGMAQARIAQLIAGAYKATGDPRFAAAAGDAIASLAVGVGAGGARGMVAYPAGAPASPWYVERAYPGGSPWMGAALNGFMVAILELRIAERSLRDAPAAANDPSVAKTADQARRLADEGAATLQRYLPLHDSGKWSYYGLLTPGHPWRTYLANATYHCYHVTLLRSLDKEYPERTFGATARKWAGYATRQGVRCA